MATGYVYDPIYLEHDLRGHPENQQRLRTILQVLEDHPSLDRGGASNRVNLLDLIHSLQRERDRGRMGLLTLHAPGHSSLDDDGLPTRVAESDDRRELFGGARSNERQGLSR